MKIFVDADSCPVKEEIISVASEYNSKVIFVASTSHQVKREIGGVWKYVDPDDQAADLYIFNHLRKGDLLVTQDIGLASLALSKGGYSLSPRGIIFNESRMDEALHFRYLSAKARRAGVHTKGPKVFTEVDRRNFIHALREMIAGDVN
ncbi:uncharacterized protein YaiI (UPF0178 family) [Oikeobacillus pervagus]|uniref:UPF0178 protein J2S13_000301 n=1 Tax=Oikeobacillus pervagus TaxID=1325931 RepID=A0AAJ1SZ39_9BACI|nr:YaiI/YqxD family protein [Oikeobacillus pervagus]MDQ0213907.1 uncharacterized protein YaiI (UPF0178 family) [Oikeobacillus pervagus]